jgi:hypothetical protein
MGALGAARGALLRFEWAAGPRGEVPMRVVPFLLLLALGSAASAGEITVKQAEKFGKSLQKKLEKGEVRSFSGCFDNRALLKEAVGRVDAPQAMRDSFVKGALGGFNFGEQIAAALKEEGSYTFLRVQAEPLRVRFRLLLPGGGVNYHDLSLAQNSMGRLSIVDVYVYVSGEALSVTLRRAFRLAVASQNKGDRTFLTMANKFQRAQQLHVQKKHRQAYDLLCTIKGEWARTPNFLTIKVMIATEIDEATLIKAVDEYQRVLPDSPSLHLILVDKLIIEKKWKEVFKHVDALDALVGGDPYLKVLRANCHTLAGHPEKAKAALLKAAKEEPTLADIHYTLIDAALVLEDWDLVSAELTLLERDFGIEWGDLSQVEGFKAYARTKSYAKWRERKQRKGGEKPDTPPGSVPD